MISQPGLPGPPGPPGLPGSPGSMVSTASLFCCCLYPVKLMLMVHDVFQGLQGVSGPKVSVSPGTDTHGGKDTFVTSWVCVLLQGEPGYGVKGDKGETGAPGPQVSDTDSL